MTEARGLKKERLDVGCAGDGWDRNERMWKVGEQRGGRIREEEGRGVICDVLREVRE